MFHFTLLGRFGSDLPRDINGYVPEAGDTPVEFEFDASGDQFDGAKDPAWLEYVADAVKATAEAEAALAEWRKEA